MIKLEKMLAVSLVVPMDDPSSPTCRWGLPLLIWGPPGIGKSSRVNAAGRAVGLVVEPVYPATRQPEDFSGVPVPDGTGNIKVECILGAARSLIEEGRGVLFIDEVSCARPAVQAALLSVVLDRRIGDVLLPPGVRILLAANPAEEAAGGWELEPPMANRMAHVAEHAPSPAEWTDWLMNQNKNLLEPIDSAEERVRENWNTAWAKITGLAAGFQRTRGTLLYALPKSGDPARGRSWPSPRTWEMALRASATCDAIGATELSMKFVEACVGSGAAIEWSKWLAEADLPDPADMLAHGWKPDKNRIDKCVAALTAATMYITGKPNLEERLKLAVPMFHILTGVVDSGMADLTLKPTERLVNAGITRKASKELEEASKPVMLRIAKSPLAKMME